MDRQDQFHGQHRDLSRLVPVRHHSGPQPRRPASRVSPGPRRCYHTRSVERTIRPRATESRLLDPRYLLAMIDDEAQLSRISSWIGEWEPCLSLVRPPRHEILYEPDGTLYALALGAPMAIDLHHRERTIREDDVMVV